MREGKEGQNHCTQDHKIGAKFVIETLMCTHAEKLSLNAVLHQPSAEFCETRGTSQCEEQGEKKQKREGQERIKKKSAAYTNFRERSLFNEDNSAACACRS